RIDNLIFDDLLTRDEHLNVAPGLAERWEIPDPRTYIFHLHHGVKFHNGQSLTSRDVKWTFDSLLEHKIRTTKAAAYRFVAQLKRVRFMVVPDTTTRALELRKGSADIAINALTADMVLALQRNPNLEVMRAPGTVLSYMAFNTRDPVLKDVRVRQALNYAIDRDPMIEYLRRGFARPASSILPPESWAYNGNVSTYNRDPERARQLL